MPPAAVQTGLRRFFAGWGLPQGLRVDNGAPWGSWSDLPTDLTLWLWGLDIEVHHNRPRHCQENGRVERSHGVLGRWAEPTKCASGQDLQAHLAAASRLQRECYPALAGQPRAVAYPTLRAGGRPYDPAREATLFDVRRVWARLATRTWRRRVDRVGRISVYNRALGVGRQWAGQEVVVRFDAAAVAWVIQDARGTTLRTHPAPELSRARILALDVTHRRPSRPRRRGKPRAPTDGGQPYSP